MKALTIKQPWAWLIADGIKDVENRTWNTRYRGPLVIHAGKSVMRDALPMIEGEYGIRITDAQLDAMPTGAIVSLVDMVDAFHNMGKVTVESKNVSKWHQLGMVGFYLKNNRKFPQPVPWRGAQGLWDIDHHDVMLALSGSTNIGANSVDEDEIF